MQPKQQTTWYKKPESATNTAGPGASNMGGAMMTVTPTSVPANHFRDSALQLASWGFKVFPCAMGGKKPIATGWQQQASSDPTSIKNLWARYPNANIGVFMQASGMVAIDFDNKTSKATGKSGLEILKTMSEQCPEMNNTWIAETPSGGYHYIFKYPAGVYAVHNGRECLPKGEKVDVRADGGFIVGVGSIVDGKMYKWLDGNSPTDRPLADLPEPLYNLMVREGVIIVEKPDDERAAQIVASIDVDPEIRKRSAEYYIEKYEKMVLEQDTAREGTGFELAVQLHSLYPDDKATAQRYMDKFWQDMRWAKGDGVNEYRYDQAVHALNSAYNYPAKKPAFVGVNDDNKSQGTKMYEMISQCPVVRNETDGELYIQLPGVNGGRQIVNVASEQFRKQLNNLFYQNYGMVPKASAVSEVRGMLGMEAPTVRLDVRINAVNSGNRQEMAIYYDLADKQGRAVKITAKGYEVVSDVPLIFMRRPDMVAQVEPVPMGQGDIRRIFKYLNIKPRVPDYILEKQQLSLGDCETLDAAKKQYIADVQLVLATYIVYNLLPSTSELPIERIMLILNGPAGSGKTTTGKLIHGIINGLPDGDNDTTDMPTDRQQVTQQLANNYMTVFDNCADISDDISNLLCIACTGGSAKRRKLFTDNETLTFNIRRPVILTGVTGLLTKPDIIDRALIINLETLVGTPDRRRKLELLPAFRAELPYILGGAFEVLSKAISTYDTMAGSVPNVGRIEGFSEWGYCIAEAIVHGGGDRFLRMYESMYRMNAEYTADTDTVGVAIQAYIDQLPAGIRHHNVTLRQLKAELRAIVKDNDNTLQGFPQTDRKLRDVLNSLRSTFQRMGVSLELKQRVNRAWEVHITLGPP